MTPNSINVAVAAYVDTCVISGYVKNELGDSERSAFERIMTAYKVNSIALIRSEIVEQEIAAIPGQYRTLHDELLRSFLSIPVPIVGGLTQVGPFNLSMANPRRRLMNHLKKILPGENDQRHVFVAARNRVRFFITVDRHSILSHHDSVLAVSGVEPVTPAEFISHKSSPLNDAGRVGLDQAK
jgi:hypothetical protein